MNVLVCGVGGQGVILFSDILSRAALEAGRDVKKSEVHGMAQRGGSVNTHIRYSEKVHSPLIEPGTADVVVAFEKLEALRYVHFGSPDARLFYDSHRLDPLPVQLGLVPRPDDHWLDERIAARATRRQVVKAFDKARELGNPRVQNVVMLGAVSDSLELPLGAIDAAVRSLVKPGYVELNIAALKAGASLTRKA